MARPKTKKLSAAQAKVFRYVKMFMMKGYAPSLREISAHCKWEHASSAAYMLKQLEDKGYITRPPGARAIVLTPKGKRI